MELNTSCFRAKDYKLKDYFTSTTLPNDSRKYDAVLSQFEKPDDFKPLRRVCQPIQRDTRSISPIRINDTNKS